MLNKNISIIPVFNICGKEENQSSSIVSRSQIHRKVTADFISGGIMMVVKGISIN